MTYYYPMARDDEIVRRVLDGESYRKICKAMDMSYGIISARICGLRVRGELPQVNRGGLSYGQLLRDQRLTAEAKRAKEMNAFTLDEPQTDQQEAAA